MIRVDIETIVMSNSPVPSVVVLREREEENKQGAPRRALSIQTGAFEAAAIECGVDQQHTSRPIAHDLLLNALNQLGSKIERVEIDRVDAPVFYAKLVLLKHPEEHAELYLDARPSDALALAVRANAPIYVEDDVMNRAGSLNPPKHEEGEGEIERFDEFVHTLSPDDF